MSRPPPRDYTRKLNEAQEKPEILKPAMIEAQMLHIWQCKETAIEAHKAHIRRLDDWLSNLRSSLDRSIREIERDKA